MERFLGLKAKVDINISVKAVIQLLKELERRKNIGS